jgi:uncharacterized membrane protein YkoI
VLDKGDQFTQVQNRRIQNTAISVEQLNQYGVDNLSNTADEIIMTENDGITYFSGSGNFKPSLLLVE